MRAERRERQTFPWCTIFFSFIAPAFEGGRCIVNRTERCTPQTARMAGCVSGLQIVCEEERPGAGEEERGALWVERHGCGCCEWESGDVQGAE